MVSAIPDAQAWAIWYSRWVRKSGDRIGDWILDERIGQGAMGEVWRAHSALSSRLLAAVKTLRTNNFDAPRERFVREIEAMAMMSHPSVVRVLGWGEAPPADGPGSGLFLAMEFIEGDNLAQRLSKGPMTVNQVLAVIAPVARALDHAHKQGISHRDVKPANIMLCTDGPPKLLDFGIAHQEDMSRLTAVGAFTGTGPYMAPEVFDREEPDQKLGDIYALGLVMYESLLHRRAFKYPKDLPARVKQTKMIEDKRAGPLDPGQTFSWDVREIVKKATNPVPEERFQSAAELAAAIEDLDVDEFGEEDEVKTMLAQGDALRAAIAELHADDDDTEPVGTDPSATDPVVADEEPSAASAPPVTGTNTTELATYFVGSAVAVVLLGLLLGAVAIGLGLGG